MSDEDVVSRLLMEIRECRALLDEMDRELASYNDLHKLSTLGAVRYLIRQNRIIADLRVLVTRANRKPESAIDVLADIQTLLDKMDK